MSFTVGRDLMVAASPKPESPQPYGICLPGEGWYDYWTGRRIVGEQASETRRIEHLPVFVRAGAILPRQAVTQSTAETPTGPLLLDVYPGPNCRGELYWDDGETVNYRRGGFLRQSLRCVVGKDGVQLLFGRRQGSYRPWWREVTVTVHGWNGRAQVRSAGRTVPATVDENAVTVRLTLPDQPRGGCLVVSRT